MTWVSLYGWFLPALTTLLVVICLILGGLVTYLTCRNINHATQTDDSNA
ncbi:hypothetical protein [uncultured Fibrella sp.]